MDLTAHLYWLFTLPFKAVYWAGAYVVLFFALLRKILQGFRYILFGRKSSDSFGSARFATRSEVRGAGHLKGRGPILAKMRPYWFWPWKRYIRFNHKEGHIMVVAPSRSGKGVGPITSTLLDYPGSMVVLDPKGENYQRTAGYRKNLDNDNAKIFRINLIDSGDSDCFNPLDSIRLGTEHEQIDANELADLLLEPESHEHQHWRDVAKQWLAGIILYTLYKNKDVAPASCVLTTVQEYSKALGNGDITKLDDMKERAKYPLGVTNIGQEISTTFQADKKNYTSYFSNINKALSIFNTENPAGKVTMDSDFTLDALHDETATIYIIVPYQGLKTYSPLTRTLIGLIIRNIQIFGTNPKNTLPENRILLLLDEAASLGNMESLREGMAWLGSYVRLMLIYQSLSQIKATYSNYETFTANCHCQVVFGVNDAFTARYYSEKLGKKTIRQSSKGKQREPFSLLAHGMSQNISETGRSLLDPAEIQALESENVLIFFRQKPKYALLAEAIRFYEEPVFQQRAADTATKDREEKSHATVVEETPKKATSEEPWGYGNSAFDEMTRYFAEEIEKNPEYRNLPPFRDSLIRKHVEKYIALREQERARGDVLEDDHSMTLTD